MTHRNMSSSQSHRFRHSDDEEEDLEALRLEALKTLHHKKDGPPGNQMYLSDTPSPASTPQHHNSMRSSMNPSFGGMHIPPNNMYRTNNAMRLPNNKSHGYYPSNHNLPPSRLINTFNARHRHEKIDVTEPYVPQRIPPPSAGMMSGTVPPIGSSNGWIPDSATNNMNNTSFAPYVPHKINDPIRIGVGNVQLSPRSLAFVAKNNDILMRRKGASPAYLRNSKSPDYYSSPSPPPYRQSMDRWSHSPPPKLKSKSRSPMNRGNNRSPRYVRRSHSRSPVNRPRSPVFRRQSLSRSPAPKPRSRHPSPQVHRRYASRSPPPIPQRRMSRSPPPQNVRHKPSPKRHASRSPLNRVARPMSRSPTNNLNGRRRSPPQNGARNNNKFRRSLSPHPRRTSPRQQHNNDNRQNNRGRSPGFNMQQNHQLHRRSNSPRRRSLSRSPGRKFVRRSRERPIQNQMQVRRRSPFNNGRRRFDGPMNGFRNRGRKRSASPMMDRRKKNMRARSVDRQRRDDNRRFDRNDRRIEDHPRNDRIDNRNREPAPALDRINNSKPNVDDTAIEQKPMEKDKQPLSNSNNKPKDEKITTPPREQPLKDQKSNEKLEKDDKIDKFEKIERVGKTEKFERVEKTEKVEKSEKFEKVEKVEKIEKMDKSFNKKEPEQPPTPAMEEKEESSEDEDYGIDLFPSSESESENEGRFKSSSSKTERDSKISTVSFTKLGESPPRSIVKELKDVGTDSRSSSVSNARNNDRDRDRGRRNYDKRRDERFRKFDSNRNRDRGKGGSNSASNSSTRRDRDDSRLDDKLKGEKPMFKSTFQAVESEARSSSKNFLDKDREGSDRKSSSQTKRNYNKDKRESIERELSISDHNIQSAVLSVTSAGSPKSTSPTNSGGSTSGISGKKPIHLRLGAMTNTFKASKKSSQSSSWNSSSMEKV